MSQGKGKEMGLNIGVEVKKQSEGWGEQGKNPQGTIQEIENRFFKFLRNKFPKGGFGGGWVSYSETDKEYDFDVKMISYGTKFVENGYHQDRMYLAIVEFIFGEFSHLEGIELKTYWSG